MYQGGYLFGNRIVINKIRSNSTDKIARGSSSFAYNGETISRKKDVQDVATFNDTIRALSATNERYRSLLRQVREVNLLGCSDMDKYLKLAKELQLCEYDKSILKRDLSYILNFRPSSVSRSEKKDKKEGYTLNKSKVRDKCTAFFELERSRKFCAFYSVSFPEGSKEEQIYKVWNSWLTNLRKTYGLRDYLWVAEYQKNGTLHYHMLCNVYMNIKRVNRAMGVALFHNDMLGTTIDKYNGVDVKKVTNNRGGLNAYLTKYISKSEEHTYKRAPWRCSQSVSALFTSVQIDEETSVKLAREFARLPLKKYENDFAEIYFFNVKNGGKWYNIPDRFRTSIQELNNEIANEFERVWLEYHIAILDEEIQIAKRVQTKRKKQLILHKLLTKYKQLTQ